MYIGWTTSDGTRELSRAERGVAFFSFSLSLSLFDAWTTTPTSRSPPLPLVTYAVGWRSLRRTFGSVGDGG